MYDNLNNNRLVGVFRGSFTP